MHIWLYDGKGDPNKSKCSLFQNKDFAQGVAALAKERALWLSRSDHLIRAARHYEGAAQILIRQAVMTAKQVWRIDLSLFNSFMQLFG